MFDEYEDEEDDVYVIDEVYDDDYEDFRNQLYQDMEDFSDESSGE